MTNGVIKGTGNSRTLKTVSNFKTLYPTYDKFADAFVSGKLLVDLGINTAGWSTIGTKMDKANLLADATAALYGLTSSATVNQVLAAIQPLISALQTVVTGKANFAAGSYVGTGTFGANNPNSLTFSFAPKMVMILGNFNPSASNPSLGETTGDSDLNWCQLMDSLSTEYRGRGGFGLSISSVPALGKKSADGKTIFWYSDTAWNNGYRYQLNTSGQRYPYLAIG